jgi:hypothetical protein
LDVLLTAHTELTPGAGRVATQWVSKDLGTYGRIGLPFPAFVKMGGYDQGMKGMGAQDVDLLWRAELLGQVVVKEVSWSGLSIPNQEDKVDVLLGATEKVRRAAWSGERDAKMLHVEPEVYAEFHGSYQEMNKRNNKRAKQNRKQKLWRQNQEYQVLGIPVAETDLKASLLQAHGLSFGQNLASSEPSADIGLASGSAASSSSQPSQGRVGPGVQEAGHDRHIGLRDAEERMMKQEEERLEEEAAAALNRGEMACLESKRRRVSHAAAPAIAPQLVCSMGTRTLAHSFPCNRFAKAMKSAMWPAHWSQPRAAFDEGLATRALMSTGHSFAGIDLFWWVDCTPLSGFTGDPHFDRAGHVGMNARIQAAVLRHRAFANVLTSVKQAAACIAEGKRLAIVFWCNAGEHRSVACAESFARWLRTQFPAEHVVRHFCADQWGRRGCGFWRCPSCTEESEVRVAVDQQWAARLEE